MRAGDDPEPEPLTDDLLPPEANGHGTPARQRQHVRDADPPCRPCIDAAARYAQDRKRPMTTPAPSPLGLLLEQATAHSSPKVQRLARRIETQLDDLRTLMKESVAEHEARAEIARLEQQLATAKAALKTGRAPRVPGGGSAVTARSEPLPCRKGCGKVSSGPQGRAGHERSCTYDTAA